MAAIAAFVVFIPALGNGFVDWDDMGLLVENGSYRGFGPAQLRWMFTTTLYGHYQPITWLTYGLDYVIWGTNPAGYHLTNNLLHAVNTLLVWFLARSLLRRAAGLSDDGTRWTIDSGALLAALLFGLHPLRVESVAWATERRDVLSACFLLLTTLAYLRAVSRPYPVRWRWIGASLVLYVLSMLSKEGGAPLPVVLLALDWYPLRRLGRPWRPAVLLEKVPYLVVAIGFSIATLGRVGAVADHDLVAQTAQAFYGLVFYLSKTVAPVGLLPLYELHVPLDPLEPRYVVAAVLVIAGVFAVVRLARRCPGALTAAVCYAAMIGPLLGFFQNGPQIVADRYSYLSTLSWLVLIGGGAAWMVRHHAAARPARAVVAAMGVGIVVVLGALTWRQCGIWRSTTSLWSYMIERDPGSSYANNSYGYVVLNAGRPDAAVDYFRTALRINPRNREAWFNLWRTLRRLQREDELRLALLKGATAPLDEIRAEAYFRLGNIDLLERDNQSAIMAYQRSLSIREPFAEAHVNLALVLNRRGHPRQAERHCRRAIDLDPGLVKARTMLAYVLERQGRVDEAMQQLHAALGIDPDNADVRRRLRRLSN